MWKDKLLSHTGSSCFSLVLTLRLSSKQNISLKRFEMHYSSSQRPRPGNEVLFLWINQRVSDVVQWQHRAMCCCAAVLLWPS